MRVIDAALLESKINEFIADDVNDIKHQQHREGAKYAVKRIRKIIQDVHTLYECSNCGRIEEINYDYCCDCGAKMDKEKSNE